MRGTKIWIFLGKTVAAATIANKVKEKEKQLKHMVDEASVEMEGSGTCKRSYSKFSYSKKEELQKLLKQPRVLE